MTHFPSAALHWLVCFCSIPSFSELHSVLLSHVMGPAALSTSGMVTCNCWLLENHLSSQQRFTYKEFYLECSLSEQFFAAPIRACSHLQTVFPILSPFCAAFRPPILLSIYLSNPNTIISSWCFVNTWKNNSWKARVLHVKMPLSRRRGSDETTRFRKPSVVEVRN